MKNRKYNKTIAIGFLFLLIGAGILPNVSGTIEKKVISNEMENNQKNMIFMNSYDKNLLLLKQDKVFLQLLKNETFKEIINYRFLYDNHLKNLLTNESRCDCEVSRIPLESGYFEFTLYAPVFFFEIPYIYFYGFSFKGGKIIINGEEYTCRVNMDVSMFLYSKLVAPGRQFLSLEDITWSGYAAYYDAHCSDPEP